MIRICLFTIFYVFLTPICITFVVVSLSLLQITFLEFFEVLLGSAEVKCQQVSEGLEEGQSLPSHDVQSRRDLPEVEASEKILQTTNSPPQSVRPFLCTPYPLYVKSGLVPAYCDLVVRIIEMDKE